MSEMTSHTFHLEIGQIVRLSESSPAATVVSRFVGGFGEVYVLADASDATLRVAAKTPRRDLSHLDSVVEQFAREASLWRMLPSHPNVLPAYDVRRYNGQPFVRMKYIPPGGATGPSVAALLSNAPPGMVAAAGIISCASSQGSW